VSGVLVRGAILDALVLATVAASAAYRRWVTIPRPPVGRFVWSDIWVMVVVVVGMPFAYVRLPVWLVVGLFGLVTLLVLQTTLSPVFGGRLAALAAAAACAAEAAATGVGAGGHAALLAVNDLVVVLLTVGVTNMWAQTGMKAPHVAALAAALTVYDALATSVSSLTVDFLGRFAGMPFAPVLAVQYSSGPVLIGLGDCLMLTIWPLVAARTYGRVAAAWAVAVDAAVLAGLLGGFASHALQGTVPLLTPLGPLVVLQYLFWRRRPASQARPEPQVQRV
jgi:hypothetical protein